MMTFLTRAVAVATLGGALSLSAPMAASAFVPAAPLTQAATMPEAQLAQYRERVGRNVYYGHRRWHRGYGWRHRRHCWRGYYGRLHCR